MLVRDNDFRLRLLCHAAPPFRHSNSLPHAKPIPAWPARILIGRAVIYYGNLNSHPYVQGGDTLTEHKFTVYYMGRWQAENLTDTRAALEQVGANLELLNSMHDEDEIIEHVRDGTALSLPSHL